MTRALGADSSSVARMSAPPKASFCAHRLMLATQSRDRTFSPSCQSSPSLRVSSHRRPSPSVRCPSTIWGCAVKV